MRYVACCVTVLLTLVSVAEAEAPKLTVGEHNVLHLDGKPFLPIAIWAQPEDTFAMWKDLGVNWFITGSHPRREGTLEGYLKGAEEHDVYVSVGTLWARQAEMLEKVLAHPKVLTLHHPDEPDKPKQVSDADIQPVGELRVNSGRPLLFMLDGNARSSAVIDPMKDAAFTIKLAKPVTVEKLAVTPHVQGDMPVPSKVEFLGDSRRLLVAEIAKEPGRQVFNLPKAATFKDLTVKVIALHPTERIYGAICEIEGLDAQGKNLLESPARLAARRSAKEIMAEYRASKKADPARLVSLTLMARFMEQVKFQQIPVEAYREFPPACDLLMFDLYPVSIWGKHLHWNAEGLKQLRNLAGPGKPLGIWLQASDAMNAKDPGLTPRQIRANAWMCLANGATFIGYFPQTFKSGFKFHEINAERRTALKAVNAEISELADLILAAPRDDLFTVEHAGGRVDVIQRRRGDRVLLVMVHVMEADEGAPSHEGLPPVKVTVRPKAFGPAGAPKRHGTGESLAAKDGAWALQLAPWETAVLVFQAK